MLAGTRDERTFSRELRLVTPERFLVQHRRTQVPVDASRPNNSKRLETVRPLDLRAHADNSQSRRPPRPPEMAMRARASAEATTKKSDRTGRSELRQLYGSTGRRSGY